jgi:tetratricopeptide (TPR) repeat protein
LPKGFIGREAELTELQLAKNEGKMIFVLHGSGGVGKTDLALEFIRRNKSGYQAHIRIDMQGLSANATQSDEAMLDVIRAFNPNISSDLDKKQITNLYNSVLNQYKTILFFDNAKDRQQIEPLNNPAAFIVVTSRLIFNLSGGVAKHVEQMSSDDARSLLYSIVDEDRFNGQADVLAYLAGYLPMAMLPLASLLFEDPTLEAYDLVQKYSERKNTLKLADPNRENLSVEASFDLSFETLSSELKERWRKLAVFPADFNLEAMQAVWQIEDGTDSRSELIKKHLLEFDKNTKRSRLHDLARAYTYQKLNNTELFETYKLYCIYYSQMLAGLEKIEFLSLKKFDFERINIEQGFYWLISKIEIDKIASTDPLAIICIDYIGHLLGNPILELRLYFSEYVKWLKVGLKAVRKIGNKHLESVILGKLGIGYDNLGDYQKAIVFFRQSLKILDEIGDLERKAIYTGCLGNPYRNLGDYQKAITYYEEALQMAKEIGNQENELVQLGNLGTCYRNLGKYQKAITYYQEALLVTEAIDNPRNQANCLGCLGLVHWNLKQYSKAVNYYKKALKIVRKIDDRQNEGIWLSNLGTVYIDLKQYQKAVKYFNKALEIANEIGDKKGIGNRLGNLGQAYYGLNKFHEAINHFDKGLKILRQIGDKKGQGIHLMHLGNIFKDLGNYNKAKEYYLQSLVIFEEIQSPYEKEVLQNLKLIENKENL